MLILTHSLRKVSVMIAEKTNAMEWVHGRKSV